MSTINWVSFVLLRMNVNMNGCVNLEVELFSLIKEDYLDSPETILGRDMTSNKNE